MSERDLSSRAGKVARWLKVATLVALALVALVLVAQNTHVVTLRLLAWELSMSLIVLLPALLLVGFGAGYLVGRLGARRGRGRTATPETDPASGRET